MVSNFKRFDLFWIVISIVCLGTAGLYSLIVSMMRLPSIYNIFHLPDVFNISLVIHVTLSINYWFIITGIYHLQNYIGKNPVTKIIKYLIASSIGLIIISAFVPNSHSIIINYIPLINNYFFIIGITTFFGVFLGVSIVALKKLLITKDSKLIFSNINIQFLASIIFSIVIAYLCLINSYLINKKYILIDVKFNLEEFTWGIGHILQYTFVEIGFLCLIKNLSEYNNFLTIKTLPKWFNIFFCVKIAVLCIAPFFYLSQDYYDLFTIHMKYGAGLFLIPTTILILNNLRLTKTRLVADPAVVGLFLMIVINLYGAALGFSIREINVTVPAHYHGSLLAIVIVIMSYTYGLLLNICKKTNLIMSHMKKTLSMQLLIYGLGDTLHITGLLVMGGYGALRKTPGDIPIKVILGKSIFIFGSILSILAGIFFIVIVIYFIVKIVKYRWYL